MDIGDEANFGPVPRSLPNTVDWRLARADPLRPQYNTFVCTDQRGHNLAVGSTRTCPVLV